MRVFRVSEPGSRRVSGAVSAGKGWAVVLRSQRARGGGGNII